MGFQNVFIFGPPQSGKTELIRKILNPDSKRSLNYERTGCVNSVELKGMKIMLWDTAADPRLYETYLSYCSLGIYCIKLSDNNNVEQIKRDLEEFKQHCPDADLILVGTFNDAPDRCLNQFLALSKSNRVKHHCIVSNETGEGVNELTKQFVELAGKKIGVPCEIDSNTIVASDDPIDMAFRLLRANCPLALQLKEFKRSIRDSPKYSLLAQEARILILNLTANKPHPLQAIDQFEINCKNHLKGEPSSTANKIMQAVTTLAIVAVVTILAAMIGFGVGFVLGSWTGPCTFISACHTGSMAASTVMNSSYLSGALSGSAFFLYGFFKESPEVKALSLSAEELRNVVQQDNYLAGP